MRRAGSAKRAMTPKTPKDHIMLDPEVGGIECEVEMVDPDFEFPVSHAHWDERPACAR